MDFIFFTLSIMLFSTGVYLFLSSQHVLRVLIGAECMLHAGVLNFLTLQANIPIDALFLAIILLVVAVAEGSVLLALLLQLTKQAKQSGQPTTLHNPWHALVFRDTTS